MSLQLLVVDDEPEVVTAVKTFIESLGYEVLALTDSREAAARVNQQKFAGAFVDAKMPYLDGPALVRHIRNSPTNSSIPIFMLTGYDDAQTMREGFRAGITFFMGKPLEMGTLATVLKLMKEAMLREKRRYIRLPLRTAVYCSTSAHQFTASSVNIGEGGMLLDASGGLESGQELWLRFSLPGILLSLNLRAKVVRREQPDRIGVQFLELTPEDRKALQDFIAGIVKE
jgi:CheY-like chemotaxis protein